MDKKSVNTIKTVIREIKDFCKKDTRKKLPLVIAKNVGIIGGLSYLFYDSLLYVLLLLPVFLLLFLEDVRKINKKKSEKTLIQFQDMLVIMSQDLQASASVENAFVHAGRELKKIYGTDTEVMKSLQKITHGLTINIPIEKLVFSMAERINEDEISMFAEVFAGAKRSGGNMVETISFTINTLLEKIRIKRETNMIISSKKLEQNIMSVIPMIILLYVKLCCGGFIESLYHCLSGVLIMTVFLIIYAVAYVWSKRIMDIEV